MSQAVDRNVPNWGKTHPIAELEEAIAILNQLRSAYPKCPPGWRQDKFRAMSKAHRLLGISPAIDAPSGWNLTIDALDHYRADWRGEVVPSRRVEVV